MILIFHVYLSIFFILHFIIYTTYLLTQKQIIHPHTYEQTPNFATLGS